MLNTLPRFGRSMRRPDGDDHSSASYGASSFDAASIRSAACVITQAADLIEAASNLLAPYDADEWSSPSGRRMDLPNRGSVLTIPGDYHKTAGERVAGTVRFRRFHLGRNGAVHGGCIAQLFDSLLGYTTFRLTQSLYQRTAFLHVDYRKIVPIETELQVDAGVDSVDGRKMFISGRILDGDTVLAEANALFVKLNPGQP